MSVGLSILYYVYYNELVEEILDSDEEEYLIVDEDGILLIWLFFYICYNGDCFFREIL